MPNVLGCYGPMPFYCSEDAIFNYKDLKTSKQVRWAEHAVYLGKTIKEFLGFSPLEVSFTLRFDASRGISPMSGLPLLEKLLDQHLAFPLIIGGGYAGMMVMDKYEVQHKFFGKGGACIVAEVNVFFSEVGSDSILNQLI